MKWGQFVADYLSFSKKDRIGIISFIVLIVIIYWLPKVFSKQNSEIISEDKILSAVLDTLSNKETHRYVKNNEEEKSDYQYEPSLKNDFSKGELFQFDPNTLQEEGWERLGLNKRTIKTIIRYTSKGGKFYKPEDLQKIWGLPKGFYEHVENYIIIATKNPNRQEFTPTTIAKPERRSWNIDINNTDTSALIELPGIGNKLAFRILNFRDKLGGFYSVDQIGETYGLADSTFQKIKQYLHTNNEVKKLNVNTATKDELKVHPYIKWNLANAIVEYRNQHGIYKTLDELKNIAVIDNTTFNKIAHYLDL